MATDATGTPTAKGIPKFNTTADSPSGLGFNAAMDSIDTLLDNYISKPSGIVTGEVPVWNGTSFVRSSVTRISTVRPQDLGQDGATSGQVLAWNGSAWAPAAGSGASLVTALPGSPTDGQEVIYTDSLTAPTYQWHLKYVSAKASNKWIFVGGAPIVSEVATSEATNSSTYVALTTAGPSIAVPVAGDYIVSHGFMTGTSNRGHQMSYDIGGTGAVDADRVNGGANNVGDEQTFMRAKKKTGLTAVTLTAKYKCDSGPTDTATFQHRWMQLVPVAIGG